MRLYVDSAGVVRWRPDGWPQEVFYRNVFGVPGIYTDDYYRHMDRAKAESVPVKEQDIVYREICRHETTKNRTTLIDDAFYEVPDSEIKPEWL